MVALLKKVFLVDDRKCCQQMLSALYQLNNSESVFKAPKFQMSDPREEYVCFQTAERWKQLCQCLWFDISTFRVLYKQNCTSGVRFHQQQVGLSLHIEYSYYCHSYPLCLPGRNSSLSLVFNFFRHRLHRG